MVGYDVTYHPVSEEELREWYFDRLEEVQNQNYDKVFELAHRFGMDEFYTKKYIHILRAGVKSLAEKSVSFEKTQGFYAAATQGFFRKYYYIRDGAFSFLLEDNINIAKYTKSWEDIIQQKIEGCLENKIVENYSSGVYIPYERLKELYMDYNKNPKFRETMNQFYSHRRIKVFMQAILYSIDHKLGLLEASGVAEPNPLALEKSESYSNFFHHCDQEGVLLYRKSVLEAPKEVEEVIIKEPRETIVQKKGVIEKVSAWFKKN